MDPLSVLSIAAAVVAFVDFGGKILKSASDYLHTKKYESLTATLEDLAKEAEQLQIVGNRIGSTQRGRDLPGSQNLELDVVLAELAREATVVSGEVGALISALQVINQKRKSGLSVHWNPAKTPRSGDSDHLAIEGKARKAEQKLQSIKSTITSAVLTCLWYVTDAPICSCYSLLRHDVTGLSQNLQRRKSVGYDSTWAMSILGVRLVL